MIRKLLKLGPSDYYLTHLRLVNAVLPNKMTERELTVIAKFMEYGGFDTKARKGVMNDLKISPSNLSNNISALVEKGFVVAYLDSRGKKKFKFHDLLNIAPDKELYEFGLINETYT